MTPEHEAHLQSIKDKVCQLIDIRYRQGYTQYGDKLWEKHNNFFDKNIEEEMIDLIVYWLSRPKKLFKIEGEVK